MSPGRADPDVVQRHLIALRRSLRELQRCEGLSVDSLRTDIMQRWAVERGLLLCIQNALDVASHVASAEGQDPMTYAESIDALVETGVAPSEFGQRFRGVAGFRNVLVRGYLDVDVHLLVRFMEKNLKDFEEFAEHVERWLDE